jgi:hypothetical protein
VANLKKIGTLLGREVDFQVDFQDVHDQVVDASYKKRLGEILFDSYLSNIASL